MDITSIKNSESLPEEMKQYIRFINEYLGVPITYISNGPEREQIIKA
jgi:adenylosuccinate synthase